MCNQYAPPGPERVSAYFRTAPPSSVYRPGIGPWGHGLFIRVKEGQREAVVGQWALIGDNAKEAKSSARIMTNNARSETVASKPTFRGPWQRGQDRLATRCDRSPRSIGRRIAAAQDLTRAARDGACRAPKLDIERCFKAWGLLHKRYSSTSNRSTIVN